MDSTPRVGYMRNFIFGVEDSLVSTVGLLSGIAAAGTPARIIVMVGSVLLFVEAFSMAVGSALSENSAEEFASKKEVPISRSMRDGAIMFFSYLLAGMIPLAPYIFFKPISAISFSIVFSLVALFILGVLSGKISHTSPVQQGVLMLFLGGVAITLGIGVGTLIEHL